MHLTAPSPWSRSIGTGGRDPSERVVTIVGMRSQGRERSRNAPLGRMTWLVAAVRSIEGLNERIGRAVSWLAVLLVLNTCLVAVLRYGTIFTRDIAPGHHTIKVHNTLFGHTVEFDAAPGEEIKYRCENGLTGGGMVMVLMLGVAYLRVRLTRIAAP